MQAEARVGGGGGAEGARHELLISRNAETLCFWDGAPLLLCSLAQSKCLQA